MSEPAQGMTDMWNEIVALQDKHMEKIGLLPAQAVLRTFSHMAKYVLRDNPNIAEEEKAVEDLAEAFAQGLYSSGGTTGIVNIGPDGKVAHGSRRG